MSNEIAFKPHVAMEAPTRAISPTRLRRTWISISDTTLGKLSVTKDIDGVLRKIEHWH
jgi:hypothetical protein